MYIILKSASCIRDFESVNMTAKKIITPKSFTTVTPMEVWVNGPLALFIYNSNGRCRRPGNSDGPCQHGDGNLGSQFHSLKEGNHIESRYIARLTSRKVTDIWVMVME